MKAISARSRRSISDLDGHLDTEDNANDQGALDFDIAIAAELGDLDYLKAHAGEQWGNTLLKLTWPHGQRALAEKLAIWQIEGVLVRVAGQTAACALKYGEGTVG